MNEKITVQNVIHFRRDTDPFDDSKFSFMKLKKSRVEVQIWAVFCSARLQLKVPLYLWYSTAREFNPPVFFVNTINSLQSAVQVENFNRQLLLYLLDESEFGVDRVLYRKIIEKVAEQRVYFSSLQKFKLCPEDTIDFFFIYHMIDLLKK